MGGEALVDANVLLGWRSKRDQWHDEAKPIVEAIDRGDLPRGVVTSPNLMETITPIQHRAGGKEGVKVLNAITKSGGFRIRHIAQEDFDRAQALIRRYPDVELPDLTTVAHMQRTDIEYIYSFDDDLDRFEEITRLTTATNPYSPE
ncbi:twitching motility protein PilT [Haladaptatus sp. R4]|uniref:type II toxin-antitoxin system VapC family toxin n=1 Tax=Haladaptatus sp. R4 TaxID=1679489 RepID=UPI0007B47DF1|nr:PIN domain-containing protein [Haladaptatus sp. R4]KZN24595.1 twitching motility protein PilT [Haladaptatus sp. R4]